MWMFSSFGGKERKQNAQVTVGQLLPLASLRVHPFRCYADTARAPMARVGRGASLRVCGCRKG